MTEFRTAIMILIVESVLLFGGFKHLYGQQVDANRLPTLGEVVKAGEDLWGEAAMRQPNGASYEFFRDLLPPPRYVHADYRYYPIVLSAPKSLSKASLVSNGSGINLRGGSRSWKENGTPVTFRVGSDEFLFGGLRDRVSEPTLFDGYLPVVRIEYTHPTPVQSEGAVPLRQEKRVRPDEIYRLEAFASTDPQQAKSGIVYLQFSLAQGSSGTITLDFEDSKSLTVSEGKVVKPDGSLLAVLDPSWKWERDRAHAKLTSISKAFVAVVTTRTTEDPIDRLDEAKYEQARQASIQAWNSELERGTHRFPFPNRSSTMPGAI